MTKRKRWYVNKAVCTWNDWTRAYECLRCGQLWGRMHFAGCAIEHPQPATGKLETRIESADGISMVTGKAVEGRRIEYRPAGSKGHWNSVVVVPPYPEPFDAEAIVQRFEEERR